MAWKLDALSLCILHNCFMLNSLNCRGSRYLWLPLFQVFNYLTLLENESVCNSRLSFTDYSTLFFPFLLTNSICISLVKFCYFSGTEFWNWYMNLDHIHGVNKWPCQGSVCLFPCEPVQLRSKLNKPRKSFPKRIHYLHVKHLRPSVLFCCRVCDMFWIHCTNTG